MGTSTGRQVTCVRGLRSCSNSLLPMWHHFLIVIQCFSLLSNFASNLLTPVTEKNMLVYIKIKTRQRAKYRS